MLSYSYPLAHDRFPTGLCLVTNEDRSFQIFLHANMFIGNNAVFSAYFRPFQQPLLLITQGTNIFSKAGLFRQPDFDGKLRMSFT